MNLLKKFTLLIFLLFLVVFNFIPGFNFVKVYADFEDEFYEDISAFTEKMDYERYLNQYLNVKEPDREIIIPAEDYIATDMNIEVLDNLGEVNTRAIRTSENGYIEWQVEVEEAGLYNIGLKYYPIIGKNIAMERELLINGELPFEGAKYLTFYRVWGDAEEIKKDNQDNELIPLQKEYPIWQEIVLKDSMGNYQNYYKFYFKKGKNTIRLVSRREPMAIDYLKLFQVKEPLTYKQISENYRKKAYQKATNVLIKLQERDSAYRSNPTIFPQFDQGNPTVEPYDPVLIRLNSIGGKNWQQAGEWISWNFEVPKNGLYKIAIKGKQNLQRGSYANRRIMIDDEVPFKEMKAYRFPYSKSYQMFTLKPKEKEEPYLFYLNKGKHTLKLEIVLGDMVDVIRTVEDSLYKLNNLYREIIMITSPIPDSMRTYDLEERIPNLIERLDAYSKIIKGVALKLEKYSGQKGGTTVLLDDLSRQLQNLAEKPDTIPSRLGKFRDNLGSLGTWLLNVRKQPFEIDYLIVASPEQKMPLAEATTIQGLTHEYNAFKSSFNHNYKLVGDVYQDEGDLKKVEPLKVWIGSGRDQAQILKRLIENDFTPKTGIPINLELVAMSVLLPATLAGTGPDVALGVSPDQPINFALRGAVVDLAQFSDFNEIAKRFKRSAIVPFQFRNNIYALPEQQPFPMLFYRKDVLKQKGIEIPRTWEDVIDIIPELQKDNMQFGFPFSSPPKGTSMSIGSMSGGAGSLSASSGALTLVTLLYQNGEELYSKDGLATNFDSELAIKAFSHWTELYELYALPLTYNAANRFRTGEMPLIITGYTFYNTLQVFAPELRGKWGFTLIPGTPKVNGIIDRSIPAGTAGAGGIPGLASSPSAGPGSIILSNAKNKEAAWAFIKWWTSKDVQINFGRQLESLMGPAARYPTANIEALSCLPWSVEDFTKLSAQWKWVRGVPEIPGGYMIGRYLDNAFRKVVYQNEPARDTLLDYNRLINEEISRKRKEFGLEVNLEDLPERWQKLYWKEDLK